MRGNVKWLRREVVEATKGLPTLQSWIERIAAICQPLADAVEGIWCGEEGRASIYVEALGKTLVVGWYHGKVEYSYLA